MLRRELRSGTARELASDGAFTEEAQRTRRTSFFSAPLRLCGLLLFMAAPAVPVEAQDVRDTAKIKVDTTFLARDINGNGRPDYIVRESRPFWEQMVEGRMSVYLDAAPDGKRAPHWATSWYEQLGGPIWLDTAIAVPGGTLAQISIAEADASILVVLHIRGSVITPAFVKDIDYGEGSLQYARTADELAVLVTSPVVMDGQEYSLDDTGRCDKTTWPALKFVFDGGEQRFKRVSGFECLRRYYLDQPEWHPPPFKIDSTILVRDLNGNGKADHLVIETRVPHPREAREWRLALYLDAPPDGREPESPVYGEHDPINARVDTVIAVPGGALVMLTRQYSKTSGVRSVFLVRENRMRGIGGLHIENGDGIYRFVPAGDSIVVESTSPGVVDGTELPIPPGLCPATQRPAWRSRFDEKLGRFLRAQNHVCIPKQG